MVGSKLLAFLVESQKPAAGQIDHPAGETAIAEDPLADRGRIETHERARRWFIDKVQAEKSRPPCGMKTEPRILGDADAARRHDAEHEGAGGRTRSIDDDIVSAVANGDVACPIGTNQATAIIGYPDDRRRVASGDRGDDERCNKDRCCEF